MVVPDPLPIFWAMTTLEGRSLMRGGLILLVLSGVRLGLVQIPGEQTLLPAGDSQLDGLLAESEEVRTEEARRSAPLGPGETLDPNRIGEEGRLDEIALIGPGDCRSNERILPVTVLRNLAYSPLIKESISNATI